MRHFAFAIALVMGASTTVLAAPSADNRRLAEIFQSDQAARQKQPIDWKVVGAQDNNRRTEVMELFKRGKIITANDYFHAAMVFQHGQDIDDIRIAFSFAQLAATLNPSRKQARWLSAAAWDRILMRKNVPQWYGTQYTSPGPDAPMALYKVDETAVTDAERAAMNVPSLQEAKDMVKQINAGRSK